MTPEGKRNVTMGIAILCVAALSALFLYVFINAKKIASSCWYISGGNINTLSASRVNITLFISIKNISDFTINLNSISIDVYINDVYITHVDQKIGQTIVSQAVNNVSVNLDFNPDDLLRAGADTITKIITNKSAVIIKTQGSVSISSGAVVVPDVQISDEISLQQIVDSSKEPSNC